MGVDISVIIVNMNTRDLLLRCVRSVFDTMKGLSFEVFVVDNASTDDSVSALKEAYDSVFVIQNDFNMGFAAANNKALRLMRGKYAMLLNTDAQLGPDAAWRLFRFMEETPSAACACGQLLNDDGSRQNSFSAFPCLLTLIVNERLLSFFFPRRFPGKNIETRIPIEVQSCIGACMLVRGSAIEQVGLLDERYFFFMEETDWARRMRKAGWGIYFVPTALIVHSQGKTAGQGLNSRIMFYRSRYAYFRKWYPGTFPLLYGAAFLRLLISSAASSLGMLMTLGLLRDTRQRCLRYLGLIAWHLAGCPDGETERR